MSRFPRRKSVPAELSDGYMTPNMDRAPLTQDLVVGLDLVCSLLNEDLPLADNIQDMVEDMRLNRDVRAPTLSVKSNSPFGDELCKLQRIRSLLPNISIQTIHRSPMFTTHAMILKLRWPSLLTTRFVAARIADHIATGQ